LITLRKEDLLLRWVSPVSLLVVDLYVTVSHIVDSYEAHMGSLGRVTVHVLFMLHHLLHCCEHSAHR